MGTPTPKDPTYDPFIEGARKRILDGRTLYRCLGAETSEFHDVGEPWQYLSIEAQKFWIDLAASVRASEPIRCEAPFSKFIQLPDGTRALGLQEENP
jgi:hypothetical protein